MKDLFAVLDATWPAAALHRAGPWVVREGQGGGKRVSAATTLDDSADIGPAEATQTALGQPALFALRQGQDALDHTLAQRGYKVIDPTVIYCADLGDLAATTPERMTTFPIWPPLAIMTEIWADGDIGPARQAVFARANGPKTAILGRSGDRAGAAAFVAIHEGTAMVHALHVTPNLRRKGLARNMMRAAACWAADHHARRLALAVTSANVAANGLYQSLGMNIDAQYHYRMK
jgi:N-acetylglutamate synthase